MLKSLALVAFSLLMAASPVSAQERVRLTPGGFSLAQPDLPQPGAAEVRTELFRRGGVSLGALSDSAPSDTGADRLALGGYAAYGFSDYRLSSSLKGDGDRVAADLSAAYRSPMDGTAAVTLGYERARPSAFSLNPSQRDLAGYEGYRPSGDLSVSLSWSHDVTPGLTLGGSAGAVRGGEDGEGGPGFRLGAGVGYKF